jgi:signal transduction histidine kinase
MNENPAARLLVVDDEVPLTNAIRDTLGQHGYEVEVAFTAREALEILSRERFEILLTDLHLPEMDGLALLAAALEHDPKMIGIMMTGQGSIDSAVTAMKAGAHDYILKPFKLSVALAILARALATRRLRVENEALQRRLQIRTAELEATNKELETFSFSVSHDLRAPLRAIEGFTGILAEELGPTQPAPIQDYLRRISKATARMGKLIEDLLRLAQAARGSIRQERVDLAEQAREVAGKLQADAPERNVTWIIQEVPFIFGDPGLIRIVLENLLSNAWKYTRNTPDARIELGSESKDGTNIYWVRDNGAGFDMKLATRLFTPFHRLHPDSQFEGSGVGLATVQRIIHRHGGRIFADAAPGKGATFRFSFAAPEGSRSGLPEGSRAGFEKTTPVTDAAL